MYDSPETIAYRDAHADCENNIFTLPDTAKSELIARIAQRRGTVRAYVHPFYILHAEQGQTDSDGWTEYYRHKRIAQPSIDAVECAFRDAARTHSSPDQTPVLVLEEGHRVQDLIRELRGSTLLPYIVPTMRGNPTPLVRDSLFPSPWGTLQELLRDIGVQNVELGGMFTHLCVTLTKEQLQKTLYVDMLLPVHPPKELAVRSYF